MLQKKSPAKRRDIIVVIIHWSLVACIILSFLTGQRIASDYTLNQDITIWYHLLPSGAVFDWHRASGLILFSCFLTYLVYLFSRQRYQNLLPKHSDNKQQAFNKIIILTGLALLFIQLLLGLVIANETSSKYIDNSAAINFRELHGLLAWAFVAYIAIHLFAIAQAKGWRHWLSLFIGRRTHTLIASLGVLISAGVIYFFTLNYHHNLAVPFNQLPPVIDGKAADTVWQNIPATHLVTRHGNADRDIPVSIKATHNNERIYFLLRWPDEQPGLLHLPLIKTDHGWQVQGNGYPFDDEREYYEDKLAIMLADDNPLAAMRSIHLGDITVNQTQPRHRRGYHYTDDGSILDIWHWKSVRSDHLFQADDHFFGPAQVALTCSPRYTAGYHTDPSTGGGYSSNYAYYKQAVSPLRIPFSIENFQQRGWMRWSDGSAFSGYQDNLAAGTAIPSIVDHGPIEGDRGDIGAKGYWHNGYWQLEISRAFNTHSPFDTVIQDGTLMWLAVFDNAQTRHSYHLKPLALRILPDHE